MKFQNKIDFHAHYLPKAYYDVLEEEGLYCPCLLYTSSGSKCWPKAESIRVSVFPMAL